MNLIHYITVRVYRDSDLGDCTNCGISSRFRELKVVCPDGPFSFDADTETPLNLCVLRRMIWADGVSYNLVPACVDEFGCVEKRGGRWYMMGGNFAYTSDSRFSEMHPGMSGAVAIHDRWEGRWREVSPDLGKLDIQRRRRRA